MARGRWKDNMKLTLDMAKKIFEMREQGIRIEQIAKELGVSGQTVRNRLNGERPPEVDTVHKPLEPTNQMTAKEYREHVLKQRAEEAGQAEAEAAPVQAEKTPENAEKRPALRMTIKTVIYKGEFGKYEVNDGDITLDVDYFPAEKLPALIDELKALEEQLKGWKA